MHLTETQLQMLADGELGGRRGAGAQRHVAQCAVCATVLARLRVRDRLVADALRALDHAVPMVSSDLLIQRVAQRPRPRWHAVAAGIAALAVAAGGAAAVLPTSAVRAYLGLSTTARHAAPVPHQVPDSAASSVGFAPAHVVNVTFTSSQASGEIGIVVSDLPLVRVAHHGGSPSYTLTTDGVLIANEGSRASYEVTLPRATSIVHIRVGSKLIFARDSGHIAAVASPDREGRYLIRFATLGR